MIISYICGRDVRTARWGPRSMFFDNEKWWHSILDMHLKQQYIWFELWICILGYDSRQMEFGHLVAILSIFAQDSRCASLLLTLLKACAKEGLGKWGMDVFVIEVCWKDKDFDNCKEGLFLGWELGNTKRFDWKCEFSPYLSNDECWFSFFFLFFYVLWCLLLCDKAHINVHLFILYLLHSIFRHVYHSKKTFAKVMVPIGKRGENMNVIWREQPCYCMKAKDEKEIEAFNSFMWIFYLNNVFEITFK